jgi:hypothetical protein
MKGRTDIFLFEYPNDRTAPLHSSASVTAKAFQMTTPSAARPSRHHSELQMELRKYS